VHRIRVMTIGSITGQKVENGSPSEILPTSSSTTRSAEWKEWRLTGTKSAEKQEYVLPNAD
jgi:hypothetical protein